MKEEISFKKNASHHYCILWIRLYSGHICKCLLYNFAHTSYKLYKSRHMPTDDCCWNHTLQKKHENNKKKNKPSFCSGSCNEIHARKKLQNKTSLKNSWNTLENFNWNFLETHLTLSLKTLETFFKCLWNCLENSHKTPFELV